MSPPVLFSGQRHDNPVSDTFTPILFVFTPVLFLFVLSGPGRISFIRPVPANTGGTADHNIHDRTSSNQI
jgi:hypothetical protein